jgi:Protein of unknown function (DUF2561)
MAISRQSALSPDSVDRILVGACVAIWLAVIGVGVAATVVLVGVGSRRHSDSGGGSHTPWLLYAVIAVSALIIIGAVPLLLRARRDGQQPVRATAPPSRAPRRPMPGGGAARPGTEMPTEKLRVFGSVADRADRGSPLYRAPAPPPRRLAGGLADETVDRMWLRATVLIVGAMGAATLAVMGGTYLMGVDNNSTAWVAYCFAAVITIAMPVIPWLSLRQLRSTNAARPRR